MGDDAPTDLSNRPELSTEHVVAVLRERLYGAISSRA